MAWITTVIYIDMDTAEVLDRDKHIKSQQYYTVEKMVIQTKIHATHREKIIVHRCRPTGQSRLF